MSRSSHYLWGWGRGLKEKMWKSFPCRTEIQTVGEGVAVTHCLLGYWSLGLEGMSTKLVRTKPPTAVPVRLTGKVPTEALSRLAGGPVDLSGNPLHEVSLGGPHTNGLIYCRRKQNQENHLSSVASLKHPLLTSLALCHQTRVILRAQFQYHTAGQWSVHLGAGV